MHFYDVFPRSWAQWLVFEFETDVRRLKSDFNLSDHLSLILRALTNLESMLTRLLHSL